VNFKTNKIKDIREYYLERLKKIYPAGEALVFLDMIFERRHGITRNRRLMESDRRLTESEILLVHFDVKELLNFKPIQYIHNHAEFLDLSLYVDARVLIPRPETEELAQLAIVENRNRTPLSVLDIGTGSGAIALALKKEIGHAKVFGCDVSTDALAVANLNSARNNLQVSFFRMDILNPNEWPMAQQYDVVISNPPYVTAGEKALMQPNVLKYEPETALFVSDDDPLLFYRMISRFAAENLKLGGVLYLEINERFGGEVAKLLSNDGFTNVAIIRDLFGKERIVSAAKRRQIEGIICKAD
jgi:release factor glutamine methyltransferase